MKHDDVNFLKRILFDDRGNRMTPVRGRKGPRQYRYYVSMASIGARNDRAGSVRRVSAPAIEQLIVDTVEPLLSGSWIPGAERNQRCAEALAQVTISTDKVVSNLKRSALASPHGDDQMPDDDETIQITTPMKFGRRSSAHILRTPDIAGRGAAKIDQTLVQAIAMARRWSAQLETDNALTLDDIAKADGFNAGTSARCCPSRIWRQILSRWCLRGVSRRA